MKRRKKNKENKNNNAKSLLLRKCSTYKRIWYIGNLNDDQWWFIQSLIFNFDSGNFRAGIQSHWTSKVKFRNCNDPNYVVRQQNKWRSFANRTQNLLKLFKACNFNSTHFNDRWWKQKLALVSSHLCYWNYSKYLPIDLKIYRFFRRLSLS